jgi:hypothetical protein
MTAVFTFLHLTKMKEMNKKGDEILIPEVAKFIVAVACIALLLYFGFLFVGIMKDKNRQEQAIASLTEIIAKADSLPDSSSVVLFTLIAPKEGYFKSRKLNEIPECKTDFCLCYFFSNNNEDSNIKVCKQTMKPFYLFDTKDKDLENTKIIAPRSFTIANETTKFSLRLREESK